MVLALAVGQLDQRKPGRVERQRYRLLGHMAGYQAQCRVRHQLERRQAGTEARPRLAEEGHRIAYAAKGQQGRVLGAGQRMQAQRGRRDDAQRAFAAHVQVAQRIAGVVLAQPAQAVPDVALGRHHFQAQHQLARVAVAQHLGAARVGGQVAANGAAALGAQAEGEQPVRIARSLLHMGQHGAGFHGQGVVVGVDGAHAVQARQRQQHGVARGVGRGAAHQPGVAALGHDGRAVGAAQAHQLRHLGRVGGPYHGQGLAREAAMLVGQVAGRIGTREHMGVAQGVAQRGDQVGGAGDVAAGAGVGAGVGAHAGAFLNLLCS